jgi:hypothetical protein
MPPVRGDRTPAKQRFEWQFTLFAAQRANRIDRRRVPVSRARHRRPVEELLIETQTQDRIEVFAADGAGGFPYSRLLQDLDSGCGRLVHEEKVLQRKGDGESSPRAIRATGDAYIVI